MAPSMKEVRYDRLTPSEFSERLRAAPIAYLPLGTLEWHSTHLPLGSDHLQAEAFFARLARRVGGVVLPPLFLGPDAARTVNGSDYYGMDIYGYAPKPPQQLTGSAYWVPDELFLTILGAVLRQLRRAGFRIVVAHGHGPSTELMMRHSTEYEIEHGMALLSLWRPKLKRDPDMEFQYDHAAANETSLMMALHPELVRMENLPADLGESLIGTIGKDPRLHASSAQGNAIIELHLTRMEDLLNHELARLRGEITHPLH